MNPNVSPYMGNAYNCFQEARTLLLASNLYTGACNRAYYAYFDAVRALLATVDIETRSHSGAHNLFSHQFVKNELFTAQEARFMSRLFLMRQSSNYSANIRIEPAEAETAVETTAEFTGQTEAYLHSIGYTP